MKRFLVCFLVFSIMLSVLPFSVYATEGSETVFEGHRYRLFDISMSWHEAKEYCESLGGHLLIVETDEENAEIVELLKSSASKNCYWIGVQYDVDTKSWKTVTGNNAEWTNWAPNEPNKFEDNDENYVHLFGKRYTGGKGIKEVGQWNDASVSGAVYAADFYNIKNYGFVCEWDSVYETVSEYDTISQYMADVIINYDYYGCLDNFGGDTPQNITYCYLLNPQNISISRMLSDNLKSDAGFVSSVAAWKTLTFSATDTYKAPLDEIGYYQAVLLSIFDANVKKSIIPDSVKDTAKSSSDIANSVLSVLSNSAEQSYEQLSSAPWEMFKEKEQLAAIEAAGKKCHSLSTKSHFASELGDILNAAETVGDLVNTLSALEQVSALSDSFVGVLKAIDEQCPSGNVALKAALAEMINVCGTSAEASLVKIIETAASGGKIVADIAVSQLWNDILISAGNGLGAGVAIGQVVGKSLSNFMFSTDAVIEQFFAMSALVDIEDLLILAVRELENEYILSDTFENAELFLSSVDMLVSVYDLSCDYAVTYMDIVENKGLVNSIRSVFGFGNDQTFEEFCNSANSIKSSLEILKKQLLDFDPYYVYALSEDSPLLYKVYEESIASENEYVESLLVTVECPTNVFIKQGEKPLVKVENGEIVGVASGVYAFEENDVKKFVLPLRCDYSVEITGYEKGKMDYTVSEYVRGETVRDVVFDYVALTKGKEYTGTITEKPFSAITLMTADGKELEPDYDSLYIKNVILGDVDGNGKVDADDYILLKRIFFGMAKLENQTNPETALLRSDVYGNDGIITADDYILLKRVFFGMAKI